MVVAAVAVLAACASAPDPVPVPDEEYDQAKSLRTRIEQNDLAQYAQSDFDAAETSFTAGETALAAEDNETAQTEFTTAIAGYQDVIRAGLRAIAGTRKQSADDQKVRADDVKADVAVAEAYAEALSVYEAAQAAEADGDDETAAELYENAATMFTAAYEEAEEKRQRALQALSDATAATGNLETRREELEDEARADVEAAAQDAEEQEGGDQ